MELIIKIFNLITFSFLIAGIAACDDSANDRKPNPNATSIQQQVVRQFVVANNFSDAEWKNGMLQRYGGTDVFYFLQEKELIKVKVGDALSFTKTGNIIVRRVAPSLPNQNGKISVFVSVEKEFDPIGVAIQTIYFL